MAVEHTNRKGTTFYLHQGVTSKGNPKFYFSKKKNGNLVEEIPAGFEIHEKPDSAQVYLRKARPSRITNHEREFTLREARRVVESGSLLVDVESDSLIVYYAEPTAPLPSEPRLSKKMLAQLGLPEEFFNEQSPSLEKFADYQKLLRFTLIDEDERLFSVERWCFRGSIDDWLPLESASPLAKAVSKYCRHLGQESFFELI
jgi:hypothetical protein